jgi:hypothetical protein
MKDVNLKLTQVDVQLILDILSEQKYSAVYTLINEIIKQANSTEQSEYDR